MRKLSELFSFEKNLCVFPYSSQFLGLQLMSLKSKFKYLLGAILSECQQVKYIFYVKSIYIFVAVFVYHRWQLHCINLIHFYYDIFVFFFWVDVMLFKIDVIHTTLSWKLGIILSSRFLSRWSKCPLPLQSP